ncbi:MAG: hypothetical protein EAZ82_05190 [Verrucomicrobia bacterium]|nr:MAG: hypothetical protein EAZ82_05190 [Verrucomicrobiota bacterium]
MESTLDCGSLLPLCRSQPAGSVGWAGDWGRLGWGLAFLVLPAAGCGVEGGSGLPQSKEEALLESACWPGGSSRGIFFGGAWAGGMAFLVLPAAGCGAESGSGLPQSKEEAFPELACWLGGVGWGILRVLGLGGGFSCAPPQRAAGLKAAAGCRSPRRRRERQVWGGGACG